MDLTELLIGMETLAPHHLKKNKLPENRDSKKNFMKKISVGRKRSNEPRGTGMAMQEVTYFACRQYGHVLLLYHDSQTYGSKDLDANKDKSKQCRMI